jgi:hypothetical protein
MENEESIRRRKLLFREEFRTNLSKPEIKHAFIYFY